MCKRIVSIIIVALAVIACSSSDDSNPGTSSDNFNRQTLLVNWADNIIIPAFQDLNAKLTELVNTKDAFVATPNQANLEALRTDWLNAYKVWQYLEMFDIGQAEAINYGFQMNIYPTSITDIENNIANGTYDLTHPNNNDAVGFPAMDYMLYGLAETDTAILDTYITNDNAIGYRTYLSDLVDQMKLLTETVLNNWTSVYRDQFVNSTSNTATSSTNKLTNDFIYYYEKGLRANKIGIPAGIFSTDPLPEKVEGFYHSTVSKTLALEALDAVQDFFNGRSYNGVTIENSFKAYLDYLNIVKNGEDLSTLINNQLNLARTKLQDLDANFTNQITVDNSKMTEAYDELQKVVVLFKVDMVQAFNISVDYVDADGD